MKGIGLEELKRIQIEVLQAVHDFCIANGITYSMACGTALGAVRHKGYIPWDDDIDIYLLREDYNRLMSAYDNNGRYRLISMEIDSDWDRPYARAYDSKTVLIEKANGSIVIGIGIDVYPIDTVPENEQEWRRFDKRRRFLQNMLSLKRMKFDQGRGFSKSVFLLISKIILLPLSIKRIVRYIDKFIKQYNKKGGTWVFESAQGMIQKNRFHRSVFENIIPVSFEDRQFMLFENFDEYLKNGYDDYMKLPPKEKQVNHHVYQAYWK